MISISLFYGCKKVFYPYEYMDDWEEFSETIIQEKSNFYSHIKMDDCTDADYTHSKRNCNDFKLKSLGEYHYLLCSKWYIVFDVF